jgi:hypothetical protein
MDMRLKAIACEVLARQLYYVAAFSKHVIDIELVSKGLHSEPDVLRAEVQRRIDETPPSQFDAILLVYGLCSNSIAGLVSPHIRMVAPRAHDCITLYLGSKERYGQEFRETPGTYWYTADYMERGGDDGERISLGSSSDEKVAETYAQYVAKFGKDNADYLMEVMGAWRQHYSRAAYIDNDDMSLPDYSAEVRDVAARRGWDFERLAGNLLIIRDLLEGRWDDERFLVVPPGDTIVPTYDERIITHRQPVQSDQPLPAAR